MKRRLRRKRFQSSMQQSDDAQWTRDEHERFVQALELHGTERTGDEWGKIAACVHTRSVDEVRQHGRRYLQHLVQQMSGGLVSASGAQRSFHQLPSGPNGPNQFASMSTKASDAASMLFLPKDSAAARKVSGGGGRKSKLWTPEEDLVFEEALAAWTYGKPYAWPKLAMALPGKTAKDVRHRYEELVSDISTIEQAALSSAAARSNQDDNDSKGKGLSGRIPPPPPIDVAKGARLLGSGLVYKTHTVLTGATATNLLDSPGLFHASSMRHLHGSKGNFTGMLSPTFLDFLAAEDKPQGAGLPPLLSPNSTSGSSSHAGSNSTDAVSSFRPGESKLITPKGFAPRIWQDFLSDEFKFDVKGLPSVEATTRALSLTSVSSPRVDSTGSHKRTHEELAEQQGEPETQGSVDR